MAQPGAYDLLLLVVFILGTTLHAFLTSLLWRRRGKVGSERVFLLVILAALLWNLGSLLVVLIDFVHHEKLSRLTQLCDAGALVGLACLPSLLLHTLLLYLREREVGLPAVKHWGLLTYGYGPLLLYYLPNYQVLLAKGSQSLLSFNSLTASAGAWFVSVLGVCAYLTFHLGRGLADKKERKFHLTVTWGFLAITGLLVVTYLLRVQQVAPTLTKTLAVLTNLATALPCLIYAYYIYKLNYMELVLVNTMVWSVLAVVVVAIYIFGIHPLGSTLEQQFSELNLNFRILEALLIIVLVSLFQPMKNQLQNFLSGIVFHERNYYRDLFRNLSRKVVAERFIDPSSLLTYVARAISREMHVVQVVIVFFTEGEHGLEITYSGAAEEMNLQPLVQALRMRGEAVTARDIASKAFSKEMRSHRFETLIPIYEDWELVGFFALGKRGLRRGLFRAEERMLTLLGNQVSTAISNTTVISQKLEMGRKLYENEKLSSLGRLSASIAHEVKNPLSSIKSITQVMMEDLPPDHPRQQDLQIIKSEIDRLAKVVNQLLHFARSQPSGPGPFNAAETLNNVLRMLGHEARQRQIEIFTDVQEDLELVANQDSFTEIFFNLIDNALQALSAQPEPSADSSEALPPREIHVALTLSANDKNGASAYLVGQGTGQLLLTVRDTGPGIPEQLRERIFEPFFTTRETGTGLGLPIVSEKVDQLGGSITLGTPETGTEFRVTIPVEQLTPQQPMGVIDA